MDYDDNDFQSQNLHLAGEGSANCPPVLRPYALPKYDFDDSLHGHLRFDSLVETEVFLGIESNETDHWIEDFSRGNSGIQFSSSAAESCSISRCNNVWSEATSSESVEMLLKSVGQEEAIPAQTTFKELDACKEVRCLTKQMEPNFNNDDNIFSQMGAVTDLQPALPRDEIPENLPVLEDVGVDQLQVEDGSETHEGKLPVDGTLGNLDPNPVSEKGSLDVTKGGLFDDGKCNDANQMECDSLLDGRPDKKRDSFASGIEVDNMTASVENIVAGYTELTNKDVQYNMKNISEENPDGHLLSIEAQNMNEKAVEKATCHLENPRRSASEVESVEAGVAFQETVINVEEPSGTVLQGHSNSNILDGCSGRVCSGIPANNNKDKDMVLLKGREISGDHSQSNAPDLSPLADKTDTGYAVEPSNRNAENSSSLDITMEGDFELHAVAGCSDRECHGVSAETSKFEDTVLCKDADTGGGHSNAGISSSLDSMPNVDSGLSSTKENALESGLQTELLVRESEVSSSVIKENELSKDENNGNGEGHSNLTANCTSAEMHSEAHATGASESPHTAFEASGEKLNADGKVAFSILRESAQRGNENEVDREGDVGDGKLDVSYIEKDSTQLLNQSKSADLEFCASDGKECSSSIGEGNTEQELIIPQLKHDADGNESVVNISLENPGQASCGTRDTVSLSSGDGVITNIINRLEVQPVTSPDGGSHTDKKNETGLVSKDSSLSCTVPSPLVETGPLSVSEAEKPASCDISAPLLFPEVVQCMSIIDGCNTECQNELQTSVSNEVREKSKNEMEVSSVQCESSEKDGDGAGATVTDSFEKASANVEDPTINCDTNVTQPWPSPLEEVCGGTAKKVADTDTPDKNCTGTMLYINSDVSRIHEGSSSAAFPDSNTRSVQTESGGSFVDPNRSASAAPMVVTAELCKTKNEISGIKGTTNQCASDSNTSNAFKDLKKGSSDVCSFADFPKGNASNCLQHSPAIPTSKIVEGSKENSGSGQLDAKVPPEASQGGLVASDGEIAVGGSKGTSERKPRRASSKATGKQSAKKGSAKTTPMRKPERAEKSSSMPMNQSGIFQLVQPSETPPYRHLDSSIKPYSVLATSTSSLPDLNTSASSVIFQQSFTDLQQVQLRAQIFVYGALIQGIAPDEAYMVSAFGGPDGGRGMWEIAWRMCIERLHGQKSTPTNPETPLQSHSEMRLTGSRPPDQVIKPGAFHNKDISSPVGRPSTKGTAPMVSPMMPISSPLWSIPTPVCEDLQYSLISRGSVVDYQQAFNPLHPFQMPPARNLAGHNTAWMPQSSSRGPWLASPQSSTADASIHFSAFPSTETVQLTPVKETSLPTLPTIQHVLPGPAQTGGSTSIFAGASPLLDQKKVSASPGLQSADPKPRKRKKISASEELGQISLQAQCQPESPLTISVTGVKTPSTLVSNAVPDQFVSVTRTSSSDHPKKTDLGLEQRATLSEDTLSKVKEARQLAEDASALAAAAVSHSQEIWNQLDKKKRSRLISDGEAKLASAAVSVAAAAAVAKAAAAAANVASNAALEAKMMAEEALVSDNNGNEGQCMRMATPVSILRGEDGTSSSSSILVAAREGSRRKIEAASAASKRAENMDAIVKAAELAAEAVSQAGTIVAMGDPLSLSELARAGPEGYWKVPQVSSELVMKLNDTGEQSNLGTGGEDVGIFVHSEDRESDKTGIPGEVNKESTEDHLSLVAGVTGFDKVSGEGLRGPNDRKVSEVVSNSALITVENDFEKEAQANEESSIKEGSLVEVLKDGGGFGAAWFTANVLSLQDDKACVCYTVLQSDEGPGKLQEWVALAGEEDTPPKIRIARPVTALGYEGTRKRRRAAMADYTWSVGDKVDAWIQESWWEGIVTEKNQKDETILTVHFPAQGEKSVVKAWHLRPSLVWKDGKWVDWFSVRNDCSFHEGDMPKEKRPRLGSLPVEGEEKDKTSKGIEVIDSGRPEEPRLLNLSANEKMFNMGKNTRTENKPDATRTIRTGLQKEGSGVVFGIPKPGKKRKFMDVSKHYVANQSDKINETSDSVKFAKYLTPHRSGPRGLKNTPKTDTREKQVAESKLRGLKSGKLQSGPGKSVPRNNITDAHSAPDGSSELDHTGKFKDSVPHVEGVTGKPHSQTGKHSLSHTGSSYRAEGTTQGPIVFSSKAPASDNPPSKKVYTLNTKSRENKWKLAPAGGKSGKIEEGKVYGGNPAKSTSEVEPRRSVRRIQPTSRLLEGLQSSLIISKIPSASHGKSQNRSASRGNNNG